MRVLFPAAAAFGLALSAAPALAWSDHPMTQPASNDMAVWAYPSKHNYCPAGLQPVVVGGVICCGEPTHVGYRQHHAPKKRRKAHKPAPTYVSYGKGSDDTYTVYEKGQ
ncbi:MAG: hypothetical protein QNJ44_23460 [Rhodobacter sp.]|nr:hypothetical protein [Rhodobacter sp.]